MEERKDDVTQDDFIFMLILFLLFLAPVLLLLVCLSASYGMLMLLTGNNLSTVPYLDNFNILKI